MNALKLAELTSGVGALVLGIGLGALFATAIDDLAMPTLGAGLVMHAWGMWQTHRLENAPAMPTWARALYWVCWLALAAIAVMLAARLLM